MQEWVELFKLSLGAVWTGQSVSLMGQTGDSERSRLVNFSPRMVRIGQTFSRSGWDWLDFLLELAGLVKPSLGVGKICQTCSESNWDWSNLFLESCDGSSILWDWERFGQNSFRSSMDWSNCLWEQEGLVKFSPGVVGIKLTFSKTGRDGSNFHLQQVGLVQLHPGVDRIC